MAPKPPDWVLVLLRHHYYYYHQSKFSKLLKSNQIVRLIYLFIHYLFIDP